MNTNFRYLQKELIAILLLSVNMLSFAQNSCKVDLKILPGHPRILFLKGEEQQVKRLIDSDNCWKKMHRAILVESDKITEQPPVAYKKTGKRLLAVSRKVLKDVFFLSYAYRMTGENKYADKAIAELLTVSRFDDWNPSHFLDVGEMTMAVAIGYDWLYDLLPPESRKIIETAIVKNGIQPSKDERFNHFLRAKNNWNQVCNAGMVYGALAIADDEPALSEEVIERALNNPYMMQMYAPDGVYSEGAVYWNYGTSFNVMLLQAMEKAFLTDFGLSKTPGFDKTAYFIENMITPNGRVFNYSDSKAKVGLNTTLFWFAGKYNDLSLLWTQKDFLEEDDFLEHTGNRLLPAVMLWSKEVKPEKINPPKEKIFSGQGHTPVCLMRTSWTNPDAVYLGFKLGSPKVSHGHMDIGSFVMVANGSYWASDFGPQDYESIESKGLDLWSMKQHSDRWKVFRYNNMAHNTLTFDGQLQRVDGFAKLDRVFENKRMMCAVSDLSDVYKGQAGEVVRGVAIVDKQYVVIRDEIKTLSKATKIRWNMLSGTQISDKSDKELILRAKGGNKLLVRIDSPSDAKIRTWSTQSPNAWDAPNDGAIFVGFEYNAPANTPLVLQVSLIPVTGRETGRVFNKPLEKWNE